MEVLAAAACEYFSGLFAFLFRLPFIFNMQKFKILLYSSQLTFPFVTASIASKAKNNFLLEIW